MRNPPLHYRRFWFWLGLAGLAIMSVLALWPHELAPSFPRWTDKALHAAAYMIIAGWFFQIYHLTWQRIALVLALFMFGFGIELAQYFSPLRHASIKDLIANLAGIIAAWMLCQTPLQRLLYQFENRFLKAI